MTCRLTRGIASKDQLVVRAKEIAPLTVTLRAPRMNALLGVSVPLGDAQEILERLGFRCTQKSGDSIDTVVPTHRPDVTREVDVIDEVIRVRGMDTVPATLPAVRATRAVVGREALVRRVRRAATSLGLSEALTFGFTRNKTLAALGAPAPVMLENPLTEDLDAMRTSLLPGLLDAVRRARRHGVRDVRLFTTGAIFLPRKDDIPEHRASFAAVLAGDRPAWLERPTSFDAWDASGLATSFVPRLVHADAVITPLAGNAPKHLHPRGAAEIRVHDTRIGTLGPLHPDVIDALDLGGPVHVVEIDLEALDSVAAQDAHATYVPIPRFPAATRDLALVVKDGTPAGDVLAKIREAAGNLAEDVQLFDRFTGGPVPAGHANLAFHVVYRGADKTLTDAEVDAAHEKVVAEVSRRFGASLRA
jgi:phenylalanyl-tRNA synthetase beta chain